ncbi:outer membrane protein assembly factor BamA [Elizabethkingia meningoseptica]|uniref:BamA/OMP85 family outer membrane protein n=1 Tax=Elizabethkingia meningoseptica TaxID=238 RepID=UPI000332D3B2|nr:POTRA domain-containing protein [Elizabethkingia meningoseptica]AQX04161.1 outer membrane protein assembly factor BamA [Elizabethkingia meningoseptica]AQX46202.1 outer membrane protein assembly factor BamA [Elizabethkingia meningoseptica]EOR30716.1 Outer membrane protein assembly factor YaeT precursor [Elizabethkingia meningoseptica ATCC 13253 = NBRC 12535]KUY18718.1 outer membrane protein assembly factor BamA [Elizabethkingia meningoseptica]OPB73309.1 outer membrane protein assembly factor
MKFRSLPIFLFIASAHFYGQVTPPQQTQNNEAVTQQEGTYVLKDIVVDGVKKYTPEQILRFTGLTKGESVEIPGQRLSTAIKKLWDTQSFSEVEVYVQSIEGQNIVLKFSLQDLKELGEVKFTGKGIKKSKNEKLIKDNNLKPGMKITENLVTNLKHNVPQQYITKGFPDAKITIEDKINAKDPNLIDWTINVDKGKRVKIDRIDFEGNNSVSASKLRKNGFKNTKQKRFLIGLLKPSKFIQDKYEEDKKTLVDYYNSLGFRDMRVVSDSITRNDKGYNIKVKVDEGKKYYIGDVTFVGNTVFSTEVLTKLLGYKKGDIYDSVGFKKKVGEEGGKEDNSDIASSYMDSGYLFSNVNAVEKSIKNDTINMEVRIHEGTKASWNRVTWGGNVTTHDHVILRSLRTRPGDLFSKANIKRTYFDLAGMSYFDPQQIGQDIKPNPVDNTADIHWTVVEKGSSQVQVQAGYGGNSFIGTLGLTFNNFSLKNFLRFKDFKPVPQGDGQILSLQAQAGQYFQNYSISFTEPWLFGTKPTALSVGFNYSRVKYTDQYGAAQKLNIFSANAGLNRLLRWPDDYFSLYTGLSYQRYEFNNYPFQFGTETLYNGEANNFAFNIGLSRNSAGPDPFFKTSGSDFEISAKLTPPYSLFGKKDYTNMSAINKYKWLEFYKIKLKADAYNQVFGKLVLRSSIEMGFLDGYNKQLGAPPFERFYMGGVGLFNGRFDGRELIPLRGYEDASSTGGTNQDITPYGGGTIYNRINFELRYPISMSQTAKIYALTFLEGGNTWQGWGNYNPFQLKRSAGIGIRVYMGAFGLIGFDFAYGFDKTIGGTQPNGWKTHFLMNQQL